MTPKCKYAYLKLYWWWPVKGIDRVYLFDGGLPSLLDELLHFQYVTCAEDDPSHLPIGGGHGEPHTDTTSGTTRPSHFHSLTPSLSLFPRSLHDHNCNLSLSLSLSLQQYSHFFSSILLIVQTPLTMCKHSGCNLTYHGLITHTLLSVTQHYPWQRKYIPRVQLCWHIIHT